MAFEEFHDHVRSLNLSRATPKSSLKDDSRWHQLQEKYAHIQHLRIQVLQSHNLHVESCASEETLMWDV
jgi:hypothetical protein